jgi:DNA-binding NarL/FixJ family response regulator
VGTALAGPNEPHVSDLGPRLRQTLAALLEGDSEKQVAVRLGLSRATIHEYIKSLYRHFHVTSRGELHAFFIHRAYPTMSAGK